MSETDRQDVPAGAGESETVCSGPLEFEFFYEMQSEFDREIEGHNFRLMCFPADSQRQKVRSVSYEILPHAWLSEGRDSFGNLYVYGRADGRHSSFSVRVHGTVETGHSCFEAYEDGLSDLFRCSTPATAPGDFAAAYFRKIIPAEQEDYGTALYFMRRIHEDFSYQKGVSDTNTTSEQTFERKAGVCQDFAHALITLCRMAGIAARYAAGILEGEGETHAWTEILSGGKWYGLDPTNNCIVDSRYIKLSHGRDCRDCLVNRGIYFNPARETQKVHARAVMI